VDADKDSGTGSTRGRDRGSEQSPTQVGHRYFSSREEAQLYLQTAYGHSNNMVGSDSVTDTGTGTGANAGAGAGAGNSNVVRDTFDPTHGLQLTDKNCPSETLSWIPIETEDPAASTRYPLFARASPLRCRVLPGQVLYIPAMWYHRVSQTCHTVSVNYWYDQKFDFRYEYLYLFVLMNIILGYFLQLVSVSLFVLLGIFHFHVIIQLFCAPNLLL
jgi:hypothetical protein